MLLSGIGRRMNVFALRSGGNRKQQNCEHRDQLFHESPFTSSSLELANVGRLDMIGIMSDQILVNLQPKAVAKKSLEQE